MRNSLIDFSFNDIKKTWIPMDMDMEERKGYV
jgi:hypothetical protein